MKSLLTGTVTFLFTDIEGSTTLLQHLKDAYPDALMECRRLVRATIHARGGQEFGTQGDAVFAAFPSSRDALLAAVAAQQAILQHPWPDGTAVKVRMGLHTGEARVAEDDYVGLDVHRAARICAAAHGGQILLSDTVFALVTKDPPDGVGLRDLGTHRLKDLKEPERLFQVVHSDLPADFPPLKSLNVRPNNLPIELTSFIGREREIAEVKRLLGEARLITLTGSGGAGKTRLALQVAADVLDGYPDGVWLVEFAPITDPTLVPKTVASTLGVLEQPGRDMTQTLTDALRPKSPLLILDNCEHLVAACASLAVALLRSCPQVRLLTTSREGLGIPGETLWRVPGLSLPDARRVQRAEDLVPYDAVRLFVERAKATAPEFTVTSENAPAVAQVCQRLDGIPLALELAAARVKVLAVQQIAARLDDRFRLLTGGSQTVLPRQQTLRAAMDWSYALLSEKEKVLFRRLCVFAGGCTLDAIEGICSGGAVDAGDTLDVLTQLVQKSLAVVETHHGEARYRLLEIMRQYGHERLSESGERDATQRRHRDWYLEWTDRNYASLSRDSWLAGQRTEHDNLRAALQWSMEANDCEPGLRLAGRLSYFWYVDGRWSEGREWLERTLALWGNARSASLAQPLLGATFLARSQGQYESARAFAEHGLVIARETNKKYIPEFLFNLGVIVQQHDGDAVRAKALFEESTALSREFGLVDFLAWNFIQLGHIARNSGEYERASTLYEESLAFARQFGENYLIASALLNMAVLALHTRDYARAAVLFSESIDLHRASNWVTEQCLTGMALVASVERQYERAARQLGAADALREALGVRRSAFMQARYDEAVAATRTALGNPEFASTWANGQAMTLEQAIEYALSVKPSRPK